MTVAAAPVEATSAFHWVPIDKILPSPLNPRRHFDPQKIQDLAATMGNGVGVIEPLVLRQNGRKGSHGESFEIVAGERRWRAAKIAKLAEVPAMVKSLTDPEVIELMLIENDQREDINALERGEGFKRALKFGFDMDTLAKKLGHTRKYVYDHIKLLELIPAAQTLLLQNRITTSHAIVIARQPPELQARIIDPDEYDVLFEDESSLFTPEEEEAQASGGRRRADPYLGMKTRSVRELEAWVAKHSRFDPAAPVNVELFPDTHKAIEDAEKVISITYDRLVHPDARDGSGGRIYSELSWKRADGTQKSKTCDRSVTGVVVVGPGRGQALKVCANKTCEVHWKAERQAKEKAAKKGAGAASQGSYMANWKREQEERQKRAKQWTAAGPAILKACAEKIGALSVASMAQFILAIEHRGNAKRAAQFLGKPKTAEDCLRHLVLIQFLGDVADAWWNPGPTTKRAKTLLKIDVATYLKKVTTTSQPSQPKKTARKKAPAATGKKR